MKRFWALAATLVLVAGSCFAAPSQAHGKPGGGGGGQRLMGRLRTIGFEVSIDSEFLEVKKIGAPIRDTSFFRSGAASLKLTSFNQSAFASLTATAVLYSRTYVYLSGLPDIDVDLVGLSKNLSDGIMVVCSSTGVVTVRNSLTLNTYGTASTALIAGQWYCIELAVDCTGHTAQVRIDQNLEINVSVGGAQPLTAATLDTFSVGWPSLGGPTNGIFLWLDDAAVNDTTGSDQNSWPGSGQIVLLKPISDNQRGSWTGGVGGTTNLWEAVNNIPPIGTATETDLTQIESADSSPDNATDEYRANMTDYATAGIVASDTITLCQAVVDHGEDVAAGTKTGTFLILSNPAQVVADAFTFGDDIGLLGTWPSNWRAKWGAAQVSPSVTLGTSPVLRVRKVTASTAVGSVDFMGICVEYVGVTAVSTMQPFGEMMFPIGP